MLIWECSLVNSFMLNIIKFYIISCQVNEYPCVIVTKRTYVNKLAGCAGAHSLRSSVKPVGDALWRIPQAPFGQTRTALIRSLNSAFCIIRSALYDPQNNAVTKAAYYIGGHQNYCSCLVEYLDSSFIIYCCVYRVVYFPCYITVAGPII